MAAGITYTPIATTEIGSNSTITFSSIPGTYTDLRLVISGGIANDYWDMRWRYNDDSNSNYSQSSMYGDGSTATGSKTTNALLIHSGVGIRSNSLNAATIVDIMNYSNTSAYKSCLVRHSNAGFGGASTCIGTWRSTAAITSIYIYAGASNGGIAHMYAGTHATLYGIAAA